MPIISIVRDVPNNVSIVRIATSDTLATVATTNYILNQMPVINDLNKGVWGWFISDTILVAAIDGNALYEFTDSTFSTLVLLGGVTSGTVLPGLANQIAVYPANGNQVDGSSTLPSLVQVNPLNFNHGTGAATNTFYAGDGIWKTPSSVGNHSIYSVFVAQDGNDSTGNGSINYPYATVAHAMSTITTNSITNPFNICLLGGTITETVSVAFKPFVSIVGLSEGVIWHLVSTSLDASWGTTANGTMSLSNFTSTVGSFTLDFSAFTNTASNTIFIENIFGSDSFVLKGSANNNPSFYITGCLILFLNYSNCFVQIDSSEIVSLIANSGKLDANLAANTLYSIGNTIGTAVINGLATGPSTTASFYSTRISTGLTGDGATVLLLQDSSGYVSPTLANGATSNLSSISNGLNANYTPSHYTPVATSPTLTTSVQAHLHGIDNALASIVSANNYVFVSNNGSDSTGTGNFENPYATVAHALTTITTNSSTNTYSIGLIGGTITETAAVNFKPWVNLFAFSEGIVWTLFANCGLDASWGTTTAGKLVISNLSYTSFDMIFDFSSYSNSTAHLLVINNLNSSSGLGGLRSINVYGSATTTPNAYISNCQLNQVDNENAIVYLNDNNLTSLGVGQIKSFVATCTTYLMANRFSGNITLTGAASGGILTAVHFYSSRIGGTLTATNPNLTVNIDVVSYKVPTIVNAAVINLTSLSNGLNSNYTPVNYTPIAVAPDLTSSLHANLAGIDAKLALLPPSPYTYKYVYVSSVDGVDAVGNGSVNSPYKTIAYTLSQITTASSTNIFFLQCYGIFSESSINLKPWIYINGNNSSLTISGTVGKDTSWGTNPGNVYISNFYFSFSVTMDLSSNGNSTVSFINMYPTTTNAFTFTGAGSGTSTTNFNMINSSNAQFNARTLFSLTNCNVTMKSVNIGTNPTFNFSTASSNFFLSLEGNIFYVPLTISINVTTASTSLLSTIAGNSFYNVGTLAINSIGSAIIYCDNTTGIGAITLANTGITFIPGLLSVIPTFSSGASQSNITYSSQSDSIVAGFTPVNYTAANPRVLANLQGIDTALGTILPAAYSFVYVYVSSTGGVNAVGNGSVLRPYLTIAYAMSQITTASASKIYVLICYGNFSEGGLTVKPWVFLQGNNSILTTSSITLDSSWGTSTNGILYIDGFQGVGNVTLTFTGATNPTMFLTNLRTNPVTWTITGPATSLLQGMIKDCNNILPISLYVNLTLTNFSGIITGNVFDIVTIRATGAVVSNIFLSNNTFLNVTSGQLNITPQTSSATLNVWGNNIYQGGTVAIGAASGTTTFTTTGAVGFSAIAVIGTLTTFKPDAISVVPTFTSSATMAANVAFTTLSHSIKGTTTNDNAPVGNIGEYISSSVLLGSGIALTNATPTNITSISLTPGDWSISANACFQGGGSTVTSFIQGAISTTSATFPTTVGSENNNITQTGSSSLISFAACIGSMRLSLASTTTVYLVEQAVFSVSTMTGFGFIGARRLR